MRIATCTPVDFTADSQFFGRDSGMLCRGFQAAGHDACVIMPGKSHQEDESGVLRCSVAELENIGWWRDQNLDLVVLYAWGDPLYHAVAQAIRAAGICLVQSLDTAGLTTPYGDFSEWQQSITGMWNGPLPAAKRVRIVAKACRDLLPTLFEKKRLAMIDCSDAVALVSAPAARSVGRYARALGFPRVADKLLIAPHPVSPQMVPSANAKDVKVLVVGRWLPEDRHQKDPDLTMACLGAFLLKHPNWAAEVCGKGAPQLESMTIGWDDNSRKRLKLTAFIPRSELVERYQQSRILFCASRHESFHISSAEALCCGCSVVVANHPMLASTGWFTTRNSGTLAANRSSAALLEALQSEAQAWDHGQRDPGTIASAWSSLLHAPKVATGIIVGMGLGEAATISR